MSVLVSVDFGVLPDAAELDGNWTAQFDTNRLKIVSGVAIPQNSAFSCGDMYTGGGLPPASQYVELIVGNPTSTSNGTGIGAILYGSTTEYKQYECAINTSGGGSGGIIFRRLSGLDKTFLAAVDRRIVDGDLIRFEIVIVVGGATLRVLLNDRPIMVFNELDADLLPVGYYGIRTESPETGGIRSVIFGEADPIIDAPTERSIYENAIVNSVYSGISDRRADGLILSTTLSHGDITSGMNQQSYDYATINQLNTYDLGNTLPFNSGGEGVGNFDGSGIAPAILLGGLCVGAQWNPSSWLPGQAAYINNYVPQVGSYWYVRTEQAGKTAVDFLYNGGTVAISSVDNPGEAGLPYSNTVFAGLTTLRTSMLQAAFLANSNKMGTTVYGDPLHVPYAAITLYTD